MSWKVRKFLNQILRNNYYQLIKLKEKLKENLSSLSLLIVKLIICFQDNYCFKNIEN